MNSAKVNKVGKCARRQIRSLCASAIILSAMNLLGILPTTAAQAGLSTSAAGNDVIVQGALSLTRGMELEAPAYSGQANYGLPADSTAFAEQMVNKTYIDNMLINNVGNAIMGATPQF